GTGASSQACQSQNHGALYTETTVRIERVISLVDNTADPGSSVVFLQEGGALQLPNGRVVQQVNLGSGTELQLNGRYVFFLRYNPLLKGYGCVKAWALSEGRAAAVAADDLARAANKSSFYHGMSESQFIG